MTELFLLAMLIAPIQPRPDAAAVAAEAKRIENSKLVREYVALVERCGTGEMRFDVASGFTVPVLKAGCR